jgi:hypothetical protein
MSIPSELHNCCKRNAILTILPIAVNDNRSGGPKLPTVVMPQWMPILRCSILLFILIFHLSLSILNIVCISTAIVIAFSICIAVGMELGAPNNIIIPSPKNLSTVPLYL